MSTAPRIIVGLDSDIGARLAERWLKRGKRITGTYWKEGNQIKSLKRQGIEMIQCDLGDKASADQAVRQLARFGKNWEVLVICPGTLNPIGNFAEIDRDEWENSVAINFTRQMRLLQGLLPMRGEATETGPTVVLFAGGGVNSAPVNYSAYTVSKIALIKMAELLDGELPDVCVSVIGPGWVDTKIHQETLAAGKRAGVNLDRTKEILASGNLTPMKDVLDCCEWVIASPRSAVGGRNISVAHDRWRDQALTHRLQAEKDMYKLRRADNDWKS